MKALTGLVLIVSGCLITLICSKPIPIIASFGAALIILGLVFICLGTRRKDKAKKEE